MELWPLLPRCSGAAAEYKFSRVLKSNQIKLSMPGSMDDEEDDDSDILDDFMPDKILLTVLQWAFPVLILAGLACTLAVTPARKFTLWSLHVWKWEVLTLVLICGRLISGRIIWIVIIFIERNLLLWKWVLYSVFGIRLSVQNYIWLGLVLLLWHFLFGKRVAHKTNNKALSYVTKCLFCLLVATLLRLVKVLASSFNVNAYFDRI